MTRSTPEWIGKTDDHVPPRGVKLRVFEAHNGICHITRVKIAAGDQWDLDHVVALCNGGENRESNLAPALRSAHRKKTKEDVAIKAKCNRLKAKHLGIYRKEGFQANRNGRFKRKLNGTTERRQ